MAVALKIALLAIYSVISILGVLPPSPPAPKEKIYRRGKFESAVRGLSYVWAFIIGATGACEIVALFQLQSVSAERPPKPLEILCPASTSWPMPAAKIAASHLLDTSPVFLLAVGIGIAGGMLRLWCYRTLGELFTFEVVMRDDHVLVTSGPYSFVRHPSYSATTIMGLGAMLEFFGAGSYVRECGVTRTWAAWALYAFVAIVLYGVYSLYGRIPAEDAQFRARFGKQWEDYRRMVPYKLVPYLL